jgi:hypothetical protein
MGQDGNNGPHSMMDGKMPAPCGDKSMIGQDGNNGPHSMMDEKLQN